MTKTTMQYKIGDKIQYWYGANDKKKGTISRVFENRVYVYGSILAVYNEDIIGKCEPLNVLREILVWAMIVFMIYSATGAGIGLISTINERDMGRDGCVYRSIMALVNPGYLATCELARARFNVEQPVQYVAPDVKELGNR